MNDKQFREKAKEMGIDKLIEEYNPDKHDQTEVSVPSSFLQSVMQDAHKYNAMLLEGAVSVKQ